MELSNLAKQAYDILNTNEEYLEDARVGAALGNSVIGSVLSLTTSKPRWATEDAVREALNYMDSTHAQQNIQETPD